MNMWRWSRYFSKTPSEYWLTLGEGDTPLVRSKRLGPSVGLANLWFKLETTNPTGSYKDRFAAAAIADMLAVGKTHCVATSSGNTGSALAAYCAASNLDCEIATVETAPTGKLKQMMAYGARVHRIRGFGLDPDITRDAMDYVKRRGSRPKAATQVSAFCISPVGMAGVKTISYELAEQVERSGSEETRTIDHVFVPAGGGGLTLAIARGFAELVNANELARSPRVECVQPEGNATIAGPLRDGADRATAVQCTSQISGLQVAQVLDGHDTLHACRESGGTGHLVTDDQTWQIQRRLAREEGIFCEPASAVPVAGAVNALAQGLLQPDAHVVCIITGIGFKDEPSVDRMLHDAECPIHELAELQSTQDT